MYSNTEYAESLAHEKLEIHTCYFHDHHRKVCLIQLGLSHTQPFRMLILHSVEEVN